MMTWIEGGLIAIVMRAVQAAIAAAPTLLMGLVAAGVLRAMVGPPGTRRLFGGGRWSGPIRAWGLATLMPTCSLGVLPIVRELRRAGVARGAVLTFALAAPVLNPFSIVYGLTLVEPWVLAVFVAASMAVSVGAGALAWSESSGDEATDPEGESRSASSGFGRLAATGLGVAREATGPAAADVALGLLGVGLLAAVLPHGALQFSMVHENRWAPLMIVPVALPAFITPEKGMMLVGEMYEHSSSPGAAFIILSLGAGLSLGTVSWAARTYGARALARPGLAALGLALALAYLINATCYIPGGEEGHTHIFDNFSRPIVDNHSVSTRWLVAKVADDFDASSAIALGGLATLALFGLASRTLKPGLTPEGLLGIMAGPSEPDPGASGSVWDLRIPGRWLAGIVVAGLLAMLAAGASIYYPAPEEAFREMRIVRADAYSAVQGGSRAAALGHVRHWERMTERLPLGVLLRGGRLDESRRATTMGLRDKLEELREALGAGKDDDAREIMPAVLRAYDGCRNSYLGQASTVDP